MLTLKRLLVIVAILLCTLSIAACSSTNGTTVQAAGANSSTSGVSTTNEIAKETTQSQASKQTTNNTNKQATNQSNNQASTAVNDSQQATGQTTVTQNAQHIQQNNTAQSTNNNNNNTQKAQNNTAQNTNNQTANQQHQVAHNVANVNDTANQNNTVNTNNGNESTTNTYIKVAQASINGQMTNILTTANGMTLYYDTNDTAANATCTGGCTQTWHPLLAQGQIITSNGITSGQITEQATANGNQVEYNDRPLYTYANDTAAGQVNGQGVNNVWYAASMVTVQAAHW
jgi:predicted lipoprotein with Yx(FWY)xxD motif